jgi:hypothetical protein
MAILEIMLAAAGASAVPGPKPRDEVALPGREIRLGDVADLDRLEPGLRKRLAPRVLAALPPGRNSATITRAALAGLVRRAVPGLELRLATGPAEVTFRRAQSLAAAPARRGCGELVRDLPAGSALADADILAVPCAAAAAPSPLRFDRTHRVVRADRDLAAGTYLGRVSQAPASAVEAGDKLSLVAMAGPVRVARDVVALQPGRAGGRVFVRDSEGNVTSAPLALETGGKPR